MRLTDEMVELDDRKYIDRNALVELKYMGREIKHRKTVTNDDLRFMAWLYRSALNLLTEQDEQIKNRDESLEKAWEEIKWLRGMLKDQEPRVLTADELYLMEHKGVYLERRNSKVYSTEPSIVIGTSKALFCQYKYILMRENKISDVRYSSDYNKETKSGWRCWSAKPTEERRKEVKWE